MDDLLKSMRIGGSGMKAQATRLRVVSENIANANSLPQEPGQDPYRRKVVVFKNQLDRALAANTVAVKKIRPDKSDFQKRFDPNHPAADPDGYVTAPNINPLIEVMDMREAERSYEANLNAVKSAKEMLTRAIGILR